MQVDTLNCASQDTVLHMISYQLIPDTILLCPDEDFAILSSAGYGVHGHAKVGRPSHIPHPVCMTCQGTALLNPLLLCLIQMPYLHQSLLISGEVFAKSIAHIMLVLQQDIMKSCRTNNKKQLQWNDGKVHMVQWLLVSRNMMSRLCTR